MSITETEEAKTKETPQPYDSSLWTGRQPRARKKVYRFIIEVDWAAIEART